MDLIGSLLTATLWSFLNPYVFIPALALGWLARRASHVAAGAVLLAAIPLLLALMQPLPPGAEIVWWSLPVNLIAPLTIGFVTFGVRGWLRRSDSVTQQTLVPRIARTLIGIVIGGALGGVAVAVVGLLGISIAGVGGDRYYEAATMVALLVPVGLLVGATILGIPAWKRSGNTRVLPD